MPESDLHADRVDAWLVRVGEDADALTLITSAMRTVVALWARASATLGDVTMTVIVGRVLHNVVGRFPGLGVLALTPDRDRLNDFDPSPLADADPGTMRAAARFVVLELLSVTGTLTAEVLTPALHAELARVSVPPRAQRSARRRSSAPDAQAQEKPKP